MVKLNNAWNIVNKLIEKGEDKTSLYDIFYKISNSIFKYRIDGELSQKRLADKLGITQAMVSKLESGIYNYTIEQLWKIATKLGFEFDILFQKQNDVTMFVGEKKVDEKELTQAFYMLSESNIGKVA
jgi:transcriptional regulator with XRE-family HTH domain